MPTLCVMYHHPSAPQHLFCCIFPCVLQASGGLGFPYGGECTQQCMNFSPSDVPCSAELFHQIVSSVPSLPSFSCETNGIGCFSYKRQE